MKKKNIADILNKILIIITALLVLVIIAAVINGYRAGYFSSQSALESYVKSFGAAGPLVFVLYQSLQVVVPSLPGFIGCAAGAGLFGSFGGFVCNYIGICIGSIGAFWFARKFGIQFVKRMISEKNYNKYIGCLGEKKRFITILILSILLPLAPDDAICYLAGLTKMSYKKFCIIILLAKPWCILAYSYGFGAIFQRL